MAIVDLNVKKIITLAFIFVIGFYSISFSNTVLAARPTSTPVPQCNVDSDCMPKNCVDCMVCKRSATCNESKQCVFDNVADGTSCMNNKGVEGACKTGLCILNSVATPTPQKCDLKSKGDADCNNKIDIDDFVIFIGEFAKSIRGEKILLSKADFDSSGKIDLSDFVIWKESFVSSIRSTPTPVIKLTPISTISATPIDQCGWCGGSCGNTIDVQCPDNFKTQSQTQNGYACVSVNKVCTPVPQTENQ